MLELSTSIYTRIPAILKKIAEASQFTRNRDRRLHDAFQSVLFELGCDAIVCRVGLNSSVLHVSLPSCEYIRPHTQEMLNDILKVVDVNTKADRLSVFTLRFKALDADGIVCFPDLNLIDEVSSSTTRNKPDVFCFIKYNYEEIDRIRSRSRWESLFPGVNRVGTGVYELVSGLFQAYSGAINMALTSRSQTDGIFSSRISELFWTAARRNAVRVRPWDYGEKSQRRSDGLITASLSLDIRRSTFAMEHAINRKMFADWLEGLVIVLKDITLANNGVFDKFTGDGVLVHFPYFEVENQDRAAGIEETLESEVKGDLAMNAIVCSWEMIRSIGMYIRYIEGNFSLGHREFGASVGLSVDSAQWSVDRLGAPIVVGRGVVHACRASGGSAGTIRITKAIYEALKGRYPLDSDCNKIDFITKEYKEGSGVYLYELLRSPAGIGRHNDELRPLVDSIAKKFLDHIV